MSAGRRTTAPSATKGSSNDARLAALALAGLLAVTGTLHFVRPRPFRRIVPPWLPRPDVWVAASGAAELACAAGLLAPPTRRTAGWATAGLFVVVFPGNVQMALDSGRGPTWYRVATVARLPVQVPLVLWAAYVGRGGRR